MLEEVLDRLLALGVILGALLLGGRAGHRAVEVEGHTAIQGFAAVDDVPAAEFLLGDVVLGIADV